MLCNQNLVVERNRRIGQEKRVFREQNPRIRETSRRIRRDKSKSLLEPCFIFIDFEHLNYNLFAQNSIKDTIEYEEAQEDSGYDLS